MSGIYINIPMPDFEHGVRTINIYADGVVTNYAEEVIGKAIPLPPHGRLIDADEVKQEILDLIDEYSWLDKNGLHNPKWCAMKEAEMVIQDAPTIIPAEEGKSGDFL